jgi:AcrR family transcriptional regulator
MTGVDNNKKDEIFSAVFEAVIRMDVTKGHMKWTISEIARASKISRTLIYYYFGKSKENIMNTALDYLGKEYFGLSDERLALWKSGNLTESVIRSRNLCLNAPHILSFYLLRRTSTSPIGEILRDYEKKYRSKMDLFFPHATKAHLDALGAVLLGLVIAPDVDEAAIHKALGVAQEALQVSANKQR